VNAVLMSAPQGRIAMADPVEALLREYTTKLRAVFRTQLEEDVTAAVRRAISGADGGSPRAGVAVAKVGKATRGTKPARGRKARGAKRTPTQIARQTDKLLAYITANPGQRSEQISEGTKLSTGELVLPIKKLQAEKKIKSSGVARGTTYTPVK